MKLNKNIQFFAPPPAVIDSNITGWLNNDNTDTMNLAFSSADSSGTISLSADGKTITFSEFNDEYQLNSNIQNNGIYSNGVLTLNTPIMAIYSDTAFSSVLLNRGETKSYPLTYNCYVKWETSPQTTFDLSTLSDITDGAHTVKVKAKASGYYDSEFSNEVSYTKAPSGYSGTVTATTSSEYSISHWETDGWHIDAMETTGTNTLSGAIKYKISTSANINKYQVTSHTHCTYVVDSQYWSWVITPSANNFTFVFRYVGSPEPV